MFNTFFLINQVQNIFFINFFCENLLIKSNFPSYMDFGLRTKSNTLKYNKIRNKSITNSRSLN
jgi:hypothetical protein